MENLGVTIEDIRKYNIEPEKVEIKKEDRSKIIKKHLYFIEIHGKILLW